MQMPGSQSEETLPHLSLQKISPLQMLKRMTWVGG